MNIDCRMVFMWALLVLSLYLGTGCAPGEEASRPNDSTDSEEAAEVDARLLVPSLHRDKAPERLDLLVRTSKGDITMEVIREWSPKGVDRFFNLVRLGFFDESPFYRVNGTVAQFAYNGNPEVDMVWKDAFIPDDPGLPEVKNLRGYLTFAQDGPGKRCTQLFFNLKDNTFLDGQGFPPIGRITSGMDVLDSLYDGYGEGRPVGEGPLYKLIYTQGNEYLKRDFPKLDYILGIEILD